MTEDRGGELVAWSELLRGNAKLSEDCGGRAGDGLCGPRTRADGEHLKTDKIEAAWRGQPECAKCDIRHLALFADLREEDFKDVHLPVEDLEFQSGATLYRAEDPGRAVFTVRGGLVKLVQYLANGDQRIVRLLRQGDTAGLEAVLDQPYRHAAVTMQATRVCRIPTTTIHQLNADTPKLYGQLMKRWQDSVDRADEWLTFLSTGTARARMARLLLYLKDDSRDPVCQLFGREDVAAILGVTSETSSRLIAELKRERIIIALSGNRFRCDFPKLQEIASN